MKLACCFPTKNRPESLFKAVESLSLAAKRTHGVFLSIFIIDQSDAFDNRCDLLNQDGFKVFYHRTHAVTGLVNAKRFFIKVVSSKNFDGYFFLEDDIILESDSLNAMIDTLFSEDECIAANAIVPQNYSNSLLYIFLYGLFHRGIFEDTRQRAMFYAKKTKVDVKTNCFSGGVTLIKPNVFRFINFRENSPFHMLEDLDFSRLATSNVDGVIRVSHGAVINHFSSPITSRNRKTNFNRHLKEILLFDQHHGSGSFLSRLSLLLVFIWIVTKHIFLMFSLR